LIDCGLFQGFKALRLRNWDRFPIDPHRINAVLLTHAHLDHTGYLPLLIKQGFAGPIFCSGSTADFCEILLPDSGHLQEKDAEFANRHGSSKHNPAPATDRPSLWGAARDSLHSVQGRHEIDNPRGMYDAG